MEGTVNPTFRHTLNKFQCRTAQIKLTVTFILHLKLTQSISHNLFWLFSEMDNKVAFDVQH